jgi:hypothetical protein
LKLKTFRTRNPGRHVQTAILRQNDDAPHQTNPKTRARASSCWRAGSID